MLLSVVCLMSVAYIGPKSRTERPRKTKIGTVVAHVTRDSDTTFKVKRSKVKVTAMFAAAAVGVGTCWILLLRYRLLGGGRCFGAHGGGEGQGISWWPPAYSLCITIIGGGIKRCFYLTSDVCLSRTQR